MPSDPGAESEQDIRAAKSSSLVKSEESIIALWAGGNFGQLHKNNPIQYFGVQFNVYTIPGIIQVIVQLSWTIFI